MSARLVESRRNLENICTEFIREHRATINGISRLMLVSSFLEDSLRIVFQWSLQRDFFIHQRNLSPAFVDFFLIGNIFIFLFLSLLIGAIGRRSSNKSQRISILAASVCCAMLVLQLFAYSMSHNLLLFSRQIAIIGSLLINMGQQSQYIESQKKRCSSADLSLLPATCGIGEGLRLPSNWLSLMGRICLSIFCFASALSRERLVSLHGLCSLLAGVSLCVGYGTRVLAFSAVLLLACSSLLENVLWRAAEKPLDFAIFDFFQSQTIVGAFLFIGTEGPGFLTVDSLLRKTL